MTWRYTFTVFTPTYNRAHLLPRLYQSLLRQSFRDFEWLVVDDGSTDDTAALVAGWQSSGSMPIRYIAKANGGKHTAVNCGAREADGRFVAILDSDDWYVPEALERFLLHWNEIPSAQQGHFVGVTALCAYPSGAVMGSRFPKDVFDSDTIDIRHKHRVTGEKRGVLRTEVLRQYPYPEEFGRYINPSLVWNRIASRYKTRFVNEVLTIVDFQEGGITDKARTIQARNPKASLLRCRELLSIGGRLPFGVKVRTYASYVRHALHQELPIAQQIADVPSPLLFWCCFPAGVFLKMRDSFLLRQEGKV